MDESLSESFISLRKRLRSRAFLQKLHKSSGDLLQNLQQLRDRTAFISDNSFNETHGSIVDNFEFIQDQLNDIQKISTPKFTSPASIPTRNDALGETATPPRALYLEQVIAKNAP